MFGLVESDSEFVRQWMGAFVLGSLGLISIGGLSGLAWWKQIPRYYGYALAILVIIIGGPLISLSPPLFLIVPGGVIFLCGLVVLVRFLKRYPRIRLEEPADVR